MCLNLMLDSMTSNAVNIFVLSKIRREPSIYTQSFHSCFHANIVVSISGWLTAEIVLARCNHSET